MGVTAHFLSKADHVRYDVMLDLCQMTERSTSDALWRQLRNILHRFGIQHKIGSVTIDNGASIVKAVEEDGFQDVPRKPTVVCCSAHVINIAVKDGLGVSGAQPKNPEHCQGDKTIPILEGTI